MTFSESCNDGVSNANTGVTVVAAPGAGVKRIVKNVTFHNRMAAESVILTYYLYHGSDSRILFKTTLAGGETIIDDSIHVLDDVDKSLMVVLDADPTIEIDFFASWGDDAA
jgi:hypothetical protein